MASEYSFAFEFDKQDVYASDDVFFEADYIIHAGIPAGRNLPEEPPQIEILKIYTDNEGSSTEVDADFYEILADFLHDNHEQDMLDHANDYETALKEDEADAMSMYW